ncbi:MAG: UbiA family prenyltransferase [Acidobacteria bacterium]|nr:UbiA family prenyltransferase [Acidobacteriota bacterium]MCK6683639.1 UbiA family prenyltransferase [Thermoanaerobaculia bacterium]
MKLSTVLELSRPFTLLPPLLGILSGAVCAFGSAHNPDPSRQVTWGVVFAVGLGSICASLLNAASNVLNQITDLDVDRVNKPSRPLVRGEVSIASAWGLTAVLYVLAMVPTWWIVVPPRDGFAARALAPLGTHECFFLFLGGLVFTLIYSLPSWGRTKRLGIWANITIAIPRGCLLKVAGWTMVAPSRSFEPWAIGFLFMLFLIGAASTKDFSDVKGDRAGGCKTLPILYGNERAVKIMSPFFVLPWLVLILFVFLPDPLAPESRLLTGNSVLLVVLGAVLSIWGLYTVHLLRRNPDELSATENHPSWTHMYLMMMSAQTGFAVAYVFV